MIKRKRKANRTRNKIESGKSYNPKPHTLIYFMQHCEIWSVARGWMPRTCVTLWTWDWGQISLEVSQS